MIAPALAEIANHMIQNQITIVETQCYADKDVAGISRRILEIGQVQTIQTEQLNRPWDRDTQRTLSKIARTTGIVLKRLIRRGTFSSALLV